MGKIAIPFVKRLLITNRGFYKQIKGIVGSFPNNEELYKLAFVHRSASLKLPDGNFVNNERLEFLGDAVLDTVVAEYLYFKFPDQDEGFLTKTRSKIVNGDSLGQLSLSLGLDKMIVSHATKFNTNKHILADTFEALVGAIYLDKGYYAAHKFIVKKILNKHIDIGQVLKTESNYKSTLIEWSQKEKKEISFQTDDADSESAKQEFQSYVLINGKVIAEGIGLSKKEAEQQAAKNAWEKIK